MNLFNINPELNVWLKGIIPYVAKAAKHKSKCDILVSRYEKKHLHLLGTYALQNQQA